MAFEIARVTVTGMPDTGAPAATAIRRGPDHAPGGIMSAMLDKWKVAAASSLFVIAFAGSARAQAVYVYGPPPPPPPPPRYYYAPEPFEPRYALDLGLDLEGAAPLNVPQSSSGNNVQGGGGIKLRIGEQIRFPGGVRLIPEVGWGAVHLFATDDLGNSYSWDLQRIFAGVRLGFGRVFVPAIYAHVGYGWRNTGDPSVASESGGSFDIGGALDLHLLPHVVFGGHIEYANINAQPDQPEWLALGVHLDLLL
jgi:hypothetical protein